MANTRELKFDKKLLVKLEHEEHEFFKSFSEEKQKTMSELVRDFINQLKEEKQQGITV